MSDLRAQLQAHLGDAFRIERELGGGGMSRVFLATEVRLARSVAIKVLSPELAQGINAERFEREILLAASLRDIPVVEYAPREVKLALTGHGAAGRKQQDDGQPNASVAADGHVDLQKRRPPTRHVIRGASAGGTGSSFQGNHESAADARRHPPSNRPPPPPSAANACHDCPPELIARRVPGRSSPQMGTGASR